MVTAKEYPIRVVASTPKTLVYMMHRRDFEKIFTTDKDKSKIVDIMATVSFPTEEQVIRDIEVLKQVQKIKKYAFMNACDTNKLPKYTQSDDPKAAKRIRWVQNMDKKIKNKIH